MYHSRWIPATTFTDDFRSMVDQTFHVSALQDAGTAKESRKIKAQFFCVCNVMTENQMYKEGLYLIILNSCYDFDKMLDVTLQADSTILSIFILREALLII